jgi:ribonuclease E
MTVVDVNTGKFTGSGGNLEETVTKNNLEAAEEMVRQLRLRDIGGIIVIDFIDMVLESNRDLVLRRLVECLGRDRTRHQVAEVTSLGLVQMTRKRIGTGLLEAFSETCEHCQGRGLLVSHEPIEPSRKQQEEEPRRGRRGRSRGRDDSAGNGSGGGNGSNGKTASPSPKDIAAMARHEHKPADEHADEHADETADETAEHADTRASDGAPVTDAAAPAPEQPADAPAPTPQQPADVQADAVTPQDTSPVETPVEKPAETPTETPVEKPAETPAEAFAETPAQSPVEPPAPAGPRLVTTSRRRVARRPAGPPAGAASDGAAEVTPSDVPTGAVGQDADGAGSESEPPSVDGDATETVHVPIKKKGSRKR